jgi:hypothetical protein
MCDTAAFGFLRSGKRDGNVPLLNRNEDLSNCGKHSAGEGNSRGTDLEDCGELSMGGESS